MFVVARRPCALRFFSFTSINKSQDEDAYRRKRKADWKRKQGGQTFLDHLVVSIRGGALKLPWPLEIISDICRQRRQWLCRVPSREIQAKRTPFRRKRGPRRRRLPATYTATNHAVVCAIPNTRSKWLPWARFLAKRKVCTTTGHSSSTGYYRSGTPSQ